MAVSVPELKAGSVISGTPTNTICATWDDPTPPFEGPRECDYLVAFIWWGGVEAFVDVTMLDEFTDGGTWDKFWQITSSDYNHCNCPITSAAFGRFIQSDQIDGLNMCLELETLIECGLMLVYRFTGVSQATPVIQICFTGGCAARGFDQIYPCDINSPPPTGAISLMGTGLNLCKDVSAGWGGGDDFWNFLDTTDACIPGLDGISAYVQYADNDVAGGVFAANVYTGSIFPGLLNPEEYVSGVVVLNAGECDFTPPVTTPDTRLGGSLSQFPTLPPTLAGRGRIGITSTSSYSIDSSQRPEERDAEEAARILDLW